MGGRLLVVGLALQVAVEPVHHAVAAVGLGHGVDQHDELVADLPDERGVGHGQAVGQLHQHLGAARLGRVQAAVEHVERARWRRRSLHRRLVRAARVGERAPCPRGPTSIGRREASSSPTATSRMSRPSSLLPIVSHLHAVGWPRRARGSRRRSSRVRVSSPGAPAMWPRKFVGEGTVGWSGTAATQGERKRGSVVAAAMASASRARACRPGPRGRRQPSGREPGWRRTALRPAAWAPPPRPSRSGPRGA